jgi:hypothetical protein
MYHSIATLICQKCNYLEYPGCSSHRQLLTHVKGKSGHMSCLACEDEKKQKEAEGDYEFRVHVAATDLSAPWCEACRHCEEELATTFCWTYKSSDMHLVDLALEAEPDESELATCFFVCSECRTVTFPIIDGRMMHRRDGKIIKPETTQQSMVSSAHLSAESWPLQHYMPICEGSIEVHDVLLSRGEAKYGAKVITSSPSLPINTSYVPGYVPPFKWLGKNSLELAPSQQKSSFSLGVNQPVWRDRAFLGQFGDCFVDNTELEGGHMGASIAVLTLILCRLLEVQIAPFFSYVY